MKNSQYIDYQKNDKSIINNSSLIEIPFKKKNIILSVLENYSWEKIITFIKSFIKANFQNCDIVIFVRNISISIINKLKSFGIIVYVVPEKFKDFEITICRWKIYLDFLENYKEKYNLVLSVDIKDTIIQGDIFPLFEKNKPFLALSYEDGTFEENPNKKWMVNIYGIYFQKTIENKKIINAGTIWGTLQKYLEFLNILWVNLLKHQNPVDQTIVNYLIYHDKILNDSIIINDNYGQVMTLGLTKRENIVLDAENNILNFDGKIASLVHQYDRHKDLKIILKEKFCPEYLESFHKMKNNRILFFLLEFFTFSLLMKSLLILHKQKRFKQKNIF